MNALIDLQGPPDESAAIAALPGGLQVSATGEDTLTLASLPVGARLVLRCRKDWRDATVIAISPEKVTLSIGAPSGHTYRLRRPPDTPLSLLGDIPVIGEGDWRAGFARYDTRW